MMCVRRYILVWQVEVLASCLVESLIIAAASLTTKVSSPRMCGRHSQLMPPRSAAAEEAGGRILKRVSSRMLSDKVRVEGEEEWRGE